MARAYIVLARNDLDESLLQVLDLQPNKSLRNQVYDPPGQTHYLTFFRQAPPVATAGADPILVDGDTYGLAGYLIDHVENSGAGGDPALTATQANGITDRLLARVQNGQALTLADINTAINAEAGVSGSDLDGTLGNSTGSVEEVLRILSGEVYLLPDGSTVEAGGAFSATVSGYFVTRPNVEKPESVRVAGRPVRGKNPFVGKVVPTSTPVQAGTQDVTFRDVLHVMDGGDLQLSAISGRLSELKATTFTFINPRLTYGNAGAAAPALRVDGATAVPLSGAARAVVVYDAAGNII